MIVGGLHEDTDEPPDIPAFQAGIKKKTSAMDALSGVVEAFSKMVEHTTPCSHASPPEVIPLWEYLHPELPI